MSSSFNLLRRLLRKNHDRALSFKANNTLDTVIDINDANEVRKVLYYFYVHAFFVREEILDSRLKFLNLSCHCQYKGNLG